jgi:hypothetical protein
LVRADLREFSIQADRKIGAAPARRKLHRIFARLQAKRPKQRSNRQAAPQGPIAEAAA